jgi:hypothetical protein
MTSSIFSVLWLLCGLLAVLTMMSLLGRVGKSEGARNMRTIHRTFGWIFSAGYVVFLVMMIPELTSNGPLLPAPLVTHATLGFVLFSLLLIKHLIVRIFKKYYPVLPHLGVIIFTVAFVVVAFTGLQRLLLWAEGPMVTIQSGDEQRKVSAAVGRNLLHDKCSRCHPLKPVYLYRKAEDEWRLTVSRMRAKDPGLTKERQVEHIVGYLAHHLGPVN